MSRGRTKADEHHWSGPPQAARRAMQAYRKPAVHTFPWWPFVVCGVLALLFAAALLLR